MAETYGILKWRALPSMLVATLASGLRPSSRIQQKLAKSEATFEQTLQALAVDYLAILVWQNTEDARHGRNRPKSIVEGLTKSRPKGFRNSEAYERARLEIIRRHHGT